MADRKKATGTGGYAVKLTPATKEKLEKVQDVLERAYRLATPKGVKPPRITQAHTVDAALDVLLGVVSEKVEIFEPGVVTELMVLAGVTTGNGVLELMNERGFSVELGPDGRPWLKGGAEGPVPIPVELPDASQAAGGMAEA